jgi:hypothetical protein
MIGMALIEVFYDPKTGEWVVDDGHLEIDTRPTKQAAISLAKEASMEGDTIQVETRDGVLDKEMMSTSSGFTKAGVGPRESTGGGQQTDDDGFGDLFGL